MFFFNWNSPKKTAQADDSSNSGGFPSMASNQPANQQAYQQSSQTVNQFTDNQAPTFQSNPTPTAAFPKQANPYGDMFNDANRFGGSSKSEDRGTSTSTANAAVTPSAPAYSNPYSAPKSAPQNDVATAGYVPADDYVEAYVPPQHLRHTPWTDASDADATTVSVKNDWSITPQPVAAAPATPKEVTMSVKSDPKADFSFDSTVPAQSSRFQSQSGMQSVPQSRPQSTLVDLAADNPIFKQQAPKVQSQEPAQVETEEQTLESQNIFHLLGVEDGNEEEKESFLDELQQVVWEDFVENDVALLLTESEYSEFKKIIDKKDVSNEDMQEEALVYLEKLVPDLEEILLEKAMELKRDMVMERIMGMKEFYANNPEFLQVISQVESLFARDMWKDGADMLNTLK